MKKFIPIIGFVIVATIAAWFFFRNGDAVVPLTPTNNNQPFGTGENINIPATNADEHPSVAPETFSNNVSGETKILNLSNEPVAGFVSFLKSGNTIVRFVDRATGHIFDLTLPKVGSTTSLEKVRVTNNTMPKIYEADFRSDGSMVLLRSLMDDSDVIENTTLTLTAPQGASSTALYGVKEIKLRGDLDSVVVGSGNSVWYMTTGSGAVTSSTFTGTDIKTLLNTNFTNWRLFKLGSSVALYPKASANTLGSVYTLSGLTKLAGPLNGLAAVGNSNGTKILYSYFDGAIRLFMKDNKKSAPAEILPASLAEKCVWSNKNEAIFFCGTPVTAPSDLEPDNWYLGRTHFTDYIWKFNSASDISQLVVEPKAEFNLDLDVYKPALTPNEDYLIFINKRDLSLWTVKL